MGNENKKRLMIVIWNMGIGGIQKRVKDIIIDVLDNHQNWEILLLVKYGSDKKDYLIKEIIAKKSSRFRYLYFSDNYKKSKTIKVVFWVARNYLSYKPRVCLTFLDYLSAIMVGIKYFFFWHKTKLVLNEGILTSNYLKIHRRRVNFWKVLVKSTYRLADLIIVPTRACNNDLIENFNVPANKILVVPNWTLFKPQYPSVPVYDFIFVGRIEKEKNPLLLIKLIKRIKKVDPRIKLCIVGEGKLEKRVKKEIKRYKLEENIKIIGVQQRIIPFYKRSKILLLPTLNEGMPNIILEAGICGVPTITTQFPGVGEVLKEGQTGYAASSFSQMVNFCKKLLKDGVLRQKMGKNAQSFIQTNFSYSNQKRYISALLSGIN